MYHTFKELCTYVIHCLCFVSYQPMLSSFFKLFHWHSENDMISPVLMKQTWRIEVKWSHESTLTHWGWVTHICISKLTIIGSDNGLSPGRRQAIIWTNAGIVLIGPLGTNFSEILIEIQTFSLKKMLLKMSSGKRRPSCLGLNVLSNHNKTKHNKTIEAFYGAYCILMG